MIQDAADPAPASAPSPVSAARAHPLAVPPLISSLQQSLCPRCPLFQPPDSAYPPSVQADPHRLPAQPVAAAAVSWLLVLVPRGISCQSSGGSSAHQPAATSPAYVPTAPAAPALHPIPRGFLPPAPAGQLDPEHQHRAWCPGAGLCRSKAATQQLCHGQVKKALKTLKKALDWGWLLPPLLLQSAPMSLSIRTWKHLMMLNSFLMQRRDPL